MLERVSHPLAGEPAVGSPAAGIAAAEGGGSIRPVVGRDIKVRRGERMLLDVSELVVAGAGVTALMGPNGAGKSLLMRCLANLVSPDAGVVTWAGSMPDRMRALRLGFVLQKPVLLRRSAHANIRHGLRLSGVSRQDAARRADQALDAAGLSHLARVPARVLSGGEQQRLAVARAMALQPECLFLDEPTANLDPASTASIEDMALAAGRSGVRVLFVTHDAAQARRVASDVVFMCDGRIVERADAERFFHRPESAAARAFLAGELLAGRRSP